MLCMILQSVLCWRRRAVTTGLISNIQKYSIHDGPGIRTTVFLKGCPLRCAWCHNPETQSAVPEIFWDKSKCIGCLTCIGVCPKSALTAGSGGIAVDGEKCVRCGRCAEACPSLAMERIGSEMTVPELMKEVVKDEPFYEQSHGGVTLSGGEPLLQEAFAEEFLKACKEKGYHTAVDTCGFISRQALEAVLPYTDLFLYDIKHLDSAVHEKYTGVSNELILNNLNWLTEQNADIWIRVPLIPGVNDGAEHIRRAGELMLRLGLKQIFLLPYHKMARAKYERLHLPYSLSSLEDPAEDAIEPLACILRDLGLDVHIGG